MLARNPDEYLRETKQDIHKRRFTLIIAQSKRWLVAQCLQYELSGSVSASGGGGGAKRGANHWATPTASSDYVYDSMTLTMTEYEEDYVV